MGRIFLVEFDSKSFYKCRFCKSHLALVDDVLSWSFNCRRGRAYLFNDVVNVTVGPREERLMISGMHTVEDVFCCCCGQLLGWKYVCSHDKSQTYKEGKYVLERWRITENGPDEEINYDAGVTPSPDRAGSEHGGSPDRIDSEHGDSPDRAGSEHGGSPDRAGSEHGGTPDRAHHSGSPL